MDEKVNLIAAENGLFHMDEKVNLIAAENGLFRIGCPILLQNQ
jgi:hypothetical protein